MTSVVLKTEAKTSALCNGADVTLTITCEGLSMPASLHRLQECADQLVAALQNAGIAPESFSLDSADSLSSEGGQKQTARAKLCCSGPYVHDSLAVLWQTITAMPFPVEISLHFFLLDEQEKTESLKKEALKKAISQAEEYAELLKADKIQCSGIRFFAEQSSHSGSGLFTCPKPEEDGALPVVFSFASSPAQTITVRAESEWMLL